jgi:hypothetical protein
MFQKNMGSLDRMIRIVVGLALVAAAISEALGPWAYVGIVPIITASLGSCPAYSLLGFRTCRAPNQDSSV